jgi:hypothetical protein
MLREDGVNIQDWYIVATDMDRANACYDAYDVARQLGYTDFGIDHRRRLSNRRDEYLVYGGVSADDYAILVIFPAGGDEVHCQVDGHSVPLPSLYSFPPSRRMISIWTGMRSIYCWIWC